MGPYPFHQYLTEKLKALREYLSLSESMRIGLNLPDLGEVMRWMAKRQELISRIDRMDEEIRKLSGKTAFIEIEWPESVREGILFLYREIEAVLQTVKTLDEESQQRIAVLRNEVKVELQKAFQGMLTIRGYMGKSLYPPKFLDVRR